VLRRVPVVVAVVAGMAASGEAPRRAATFDGRIRVVAASGNTIYAGGHWDNVCPEGVSQGTGGGFDCAGSALTRHKLLSVDEFTGRLTDWNRAPTARSGCSG